MPAFAFDYDAVLNSLLTENGLVPETEYKPRELAQELGLNPPLPCNHKGGCNYSGPCAFVHPGEEGTGLKYFAERTRLDPKTQEMVTQKAVIRLVNEDGSTPGFYVRRRQNHSWSEWCAVKGIKYSANRSSPPAPPSAPRRNAPSAPKGKTWASVTSAPAPAPVTSAPAPVRQHQMPQLPHPAYGYPGAYPPYGYPQAYPQGYQGYPQAYATQGYHGAYPQPYQWGYHGMPPPRPHEEITAEKYGNTLFAKVNTLFPTIKDAIVAKGHLPKTVTNLPGKITGMLLHLSFEEIERAMADNDLLVDHLFDACNVLCQHEAK